LLFGLKIKSDENSLTFRYIMKFLKVTGLIFLNQTREKKMKITTDIIISGCWKFCCHLPWVSSFSLFVRQQQKKKNAISYHANGRELRQYKGSCIFTVRFLDSTPVKQTYVLCGWHSLTGKVSDSSPESVLTKNSHADI
jgi:hypothetical protein